MNLVFELGLGILTALAGLIAPGMLNMTALKIKMNVGLKQSVQYSVGAIVIIFFQSLAGVFFADWLSNHQEVILLLKKIGIGVFYVLSIYFFYLSYKNSKPGAELKAPKKKYFARGVGMSALNMLSIPFYVAMALVYVGKGWLSSDLLDTLFFCLGAGIGSAAIFFLYIRFADFIKREVGFIARNINVILGVIFVLIASSTLYNL
ncbi:MAG: hypothetical protein ACPGRE_03625 [Flavobacteriaceae bacterium]